MNEGYPQLLVSYMTHAPMVLNEDGTIPDVLTPDPRLLEEAAYLGQRADFITIPSNTPHFFAGAIAEYAKKEVLNMVDLVLEELKRRKAKKVGLIGFGPTLQSRLYQDGLDAVEIECVTCDNEYIDPIDQAIGDVMEGKINANCYEVAWACSYLFERHKVDAVILGCSELPFLSGLVADTRKLINPVALLAAAAVERAIEE